MKVGILDSRFKVFSYTRNLIGVVPDVEYMGVKDLFGRLELGVRRLNQIAHRELISPRDLSNQFYDFNRNKIDVLHLFNGISYGQTPWVTSFETIIPRFNNILHRNDPSTKGLSKMIGQFEDRRAFEAMAGTACKRLISLSECTAEIERNLFADFKVSPEVNKKLIVLHPPQSVLVSTYADKHVDLTGGIKFLFVGFSFFRKGGREMLEVFKKIRDECNYNLELTIVSSLRIENYASGETYQDVQTVENFIAENSEWITFFRHLPNAEVLELMKGSHVGLLPTYADSYGYSVLECQSAGCPVISTNIRALPEINDDQKGWLIDVPKDLSGEAIYTTAEDRQKLSNAISSGLEKIIHEIFADPSSISKKGEAAIQYIKDYHSPQKFATQLKSIYLDAMN